MTLRGYSVPRTPRGQANLVPPPPWHYVGDFLVVEYWADPEVAASLLPDGLARHPDAGRCAAVFADWQSCSDGGDELIDPVALAVQGVLHRRQRAARRRGGHDLPVHLGRSRLRARARLDPGLPQEARLDLDHPQLRARLARPVFAGSRLRATCAAYGAGSSRATVTLERPSPEGSLHTAPPIVNVRHFPRLAAGRHDDPQVHELVRSRSRDRAVSEIWEGPATLELTPAPGEEHTLLAPVRSARASASPSPTRSTTSRPVLELGRSDWRKATARSRGRRRRRLDRPFHRRRAGCRVTSASVDLAPIDEQPLAEISAGPPGRPTGRSGGDRRFPAWAGSARGPAARTCTASPT